VTATPSAPSQRRDRLLQLIREAAKTCLPDNLDTLFYPFGHELPDPTKLQQRLLEQLDVLDRAQIFWDALGDETGRERFLRFLAYRALGPAHVRLEFDPLQYRRAVVDLNQHALVALNALDLPHGPPWEWFMNRYNFAHYGLPIDVVGQQLPLAQTMLFSQYAYRDMSVSARPLPGDVALDAGGCWGDTALWLSHVVGDTGEVHTFEPVPKNGTLLGINLELNPGLAKRIRRWNDPLGEVSGRQVWVDDDMGPSMRLAQEAGDPAKPRVALRTRTIDDYVAAGEIPRVDFLKVDVEGADLGVLQGASEVLKTFRPRLAIACYHRADDLVVIPDFVASLGMKYKWYLQHSTMVDIDTVAFGVPVVSGRETV
jgi:FkbM family methyltransferase